MHRGTLNIPEPEELKGTQILMPYFFVADSIFALHPNLMKPYTRSEYLTKNQEKYNYRISRARINIECAFGILVSRWRVFDRPLAVNLLTSEKIIMATMLLHNFIITEDWKEGRSDYISENWTEHNKKQLVVRNDERILNSSESQRKKLMNYFCSAQGAIPEK